MSRIGAFRNKNGDVEFSVWAPKVKNISLIICSQNSQIVYPMQPDAKGCFHFTFSETLSVIDYFYLIDGKKKRPDPQSLWQPTGVHGPSRFVDTKSFIWNDQDWKGISLKDYIIYELHIGTFTLEGTFEAAIAKLPYLKELGITAIEVMPIIEFPGNRNWGYDGVFPYAPHHGYGGPIGLQKFIDASHQQGLAVVLDVVYNHLGPEGNYLHDYGFYFTDRYKTPWGLSINFDGSDSTLVRKYFIDNTLYWLEEYHVDALRLDAIHAIFDNSSPHILKEMRAIFLDRAKLLGREAYIIAESDLNDVRIINPPEKKGYGIDAQWSDDFHHAMHALLTQTKWAYFLDFGLISHLVKALQEGFVYDGQWSQYRNKNFGSSSVENPGQQFVITLQNHDQIGNAGRGFRLGTMIDLEQYKLATVILFCAPYIPLIFMGQEWLASTPFLYFTSFEDQELARSVREGYQKEFPFEGNVEDFDPQNEQRFLSSKLDWSELNQSRHQEMHKFYCELIELRKTKKCLSNMRKDLTFVIYSEEMKWLAMMRKDPDGSPIVLVANFSDLHQKIEVPFLNGKWNLCFSTNQKEINLEEKEVSLPATSAVIFEPSISSDMSGLTK